MWVVDLPFAAEPLWQVEQPCVTPVWLKTAPLKLVVFLWQLSHGAFVVMCVLVLPFAAVPLWQDAQFVLTFGWTKAQLAVV